MFSTVRSDSNATQSHSSLSFSVLLCEMRDWTWLPKTDSSLKISTLVSLTAYRYVQDHR